MGTSINWDRTTTTLHRFHRDLTGQDDNWPIPDITASPITDEQRRRARLTWSDRVRAAYVSASLAADLSHRLIVLGAPVELLSGTSYTAEELLRQLNVAIHLLRPLNPDSPLVIPDRLLDTGPEPTSWETALQKSVELFVFNLGLSQPIYEGIAAASSDPAMAELCFAVANSLDEITTFGTAAIQWMGTELPSRTTAPAQKKLPALLAAYEKLCEGSPEMLDTMAGEEITVRTRPGNLGTLQPEHLAAIFYDTLNTAIFPCLDELGWQGLNAWQRHYRQNSHPDQPDAVIAAVGLYSSRPR